MTYPQNMNKPVAVNESPTTPFATQKPDNMNNKPAVEDRQKLIGEIMHGCLECENSHELSSKLEEILSKHEAKEIRDSEGRATSGYGWMLWCEEAEKERDEYKKERDRLIHEFVRTNDCLKNLTAERDRLKAALNLAYVYVMDEASSRLTDGPEDRPIRLEAKRRLRIIDEALSAKHDGGGL